ncbi:hypothetical protein LTR66_005570, partial [Elasticomyces elasticus]
FRKAVSRQEVREWIEKAARTHGRINVIVGYQTVQDARLSEAAVRSKTSKAGAKLAASAAIAGAGIILPSGNVTDPAFDHASYESAKHRKTLVAPGEQIAAVQYLRVRFEWYSSRDLDQANLENDARWEVSWDVRRGQDEGVNDICEVDIEVDEDAEREVSDSDSLSNYSGEGSFFSFVFGSTKILNYTSAFTVYL